MLSYEEIDLLRAKGAPELFSRDQEGIYQTLAEYYQSKECANRTLYPDHVEALEFRAISHERAVGNEDSQHAYEYNPFYSQLATSWICALPSVA